MNVCGAQHRALGQQKLCSEEVQHLSREGSEPRAAAEPQGWTNASTQPASLQAPLVSPRPWTTSVAVTSHKGLGHRGWSGSALMQDFAGTALPECKHPSHLRTGTPAKTLKNKLHKHLWGGWTCHNRAAAAQRGRGGLKDSGTIHKSANTRLPEPGVQKAQGLRHHTKPQPVAGVSH